MGLQRAGDEIADEFAAGAWFHFNPRRAHLGRLALTPPDDGSPALDPDSVLNPRTELDLWSGRVHAMYLLHGETVAVTTVGHPSDASFAVQVESRLLSQGWGVSWMFDAQPDDLAAFELPLRESTHWSRRAPGAATARRRIEETTYHVEVSTDGVLDARGDAALALSLIHI